MYSVVMVPDSHSYGGGVSINDGTFRIIAGIIYGSEAATHLKNRASSQYAALYRYSGTAQYGYFNGNTWVSRGNLSSTNTTIKVENGEFVP